MRRSIIAAALIFAASPAFAQPRTATVPNPIEGRAPAAVPCQKDADAGGLHATRDEMPAPANGHRAGSVSGVGDFA